MYLQPITMGHTIIFSRSLTNKSRVVKPRITKTVFFNCRTFILSRTFSYLCWAWCPRFNCMLLHNLHNWIHYLIVRIHRWIFIQSNLTISLSRQWYIFEWFYTFKRWYTVIPLIMAELTFVSLIVSLKS